jgi:hypothetical protein
VSRFSNRTFAGGSEMKSGRIRQALRIDQVKRVDGCGIQQLIGPCPADKISSSPVLEEPATAAKVTKRPGPSRARYPRLSPPLRRKGLVYREARTGVGATGSCEQRRTDAVPCDVAERNHEATVGNILPVIYRRSHFFWLDSSSRELPHQSRKPTSVFTPSFCS